MNKVVEIISHKTKRDLLIDTSVLSYVVFEPDGIEDCNTKMTLMMPEGIPLPKIVQGKWQANKEKYLSLLVGEEKHIVFVIA